MDLTNSSPTTGWLTSSEAATYLKIKRRTLLAWVREGTIHGYALHGTKRRVWRFRREDLDAAMGFVTPPNTAAMLESLASSVVRGIQ